MMYRNLAGLIGIGFVLAPFASCLDEIQNVYNPGDTVAVVRQHGDSAFMMADTPYGWIYAEDFSSYSEGKCLRVNFEYDPNLPENSGASRQSYYTVKLKGKADVPQRSAETPRTDTGRLLPNEQPVLAAVSPLDSSFYVRIGSYLFLPSICQTGGKQSLEWQLTYDATQLPVVEDRKAIYSLYLRARATAGRSEGEKVVNVLSLNAFDLSRFISSMREQGGRDANMYIRIHYVDRINPLDSTQFTWGMTNPLLIE